MRQFRSYDGPKQKIQWHFRVSGDKKEKNLESIGGKVQKKIEKKAQI